jgi:hypothetical protein
MENYHSRDSLKLPSIGKLIFKFINEPVCALIWGASVNLPFAQLQNGKLKF